MKNYIDRIEIFMLCFTVFAMPIHIKVTSMSIGFLILISFLKKENYPQLLSSLKDYKFWILIFPYIVYWIGLLNTPYKHLKDGFQQIEIVSSLLIFPIVFTSFKTNSVSNKSKYIQSSLILGVLFSYFICLSVALPEFINKKDLGVLFYSRFSNVIKGPHHLSYCVIFALIILVSSIFNKTPLLLTNKRYVGLKVTIFVILSVFLFQLSSKATIILYFVCMAIVFAYTVIKRIIPLRIALPIVLSIAFLSVFLYNLPNVKMRFNKMFNVLFDTKHIDYHSQESTSLRIAAYSAGKSIIKENFWIGVGTGELAYALSKYYKYHDFQGAYIKYISPHNQFVRSFAMHGLLGFVSVAILFILMFIVVFKERNFLMFFWAFIMFVLFNVEDMFGIQDGIVFFAFYTSYFILNPKDTKVSIPEKSDIGS